MRLTSLLLICLPFFASPIIAHAETPEEYAARLEQWRQVCSDPNPDLAAGHLQSALASSDAAARKICLRATLSSDNEDLRSTALRQVVGTLPLIRFRVTFPEASANTLVALNTQNGLFFRAKDGDAVAGSAIWQPLLIDGTTHDAANGEVHVFGSEIIWAGKWTSTGGAQRWQDCSLRTALSQGSRIAGQLVCDGGAPFAVEADLLD
ncbi:hypothetical protein FA743_19845 [Paracoccus gahaiensis]|uniref:Uncharacterized protein n=1 Tax=Paracoccus gahaiensis TaxID=1706839 RepID=A0A4U0R1R6_9RHOB|nr:hypothetical protein [Paracoccus gahaiensis]TJZ88741.1 hypothetical protein FA743_19845 [Paracoccus gahaiensis]